MNHKCYINSVAQISCQNPLSEEWISSPRTYDKKYCRAIEPETKGLIEPSESRRMSKILKRTICSSLTALHRSGIEHPDAVITGTGMGCMENTEKFLIDLCKYGENCLKPTLFMQSTHNTISSLIAIILKCHGYNNTYSQGGTSFESALLDAWLQIGGGQIRNALVGAHDEVPPLIAAVLEYTHPEYAFISEASVATMLSDKPMGGNALRVSEVFIGNNLTPDSVAQKLRTNDSVILTGINGNAKNDTPYRAALQGLHHTPILLKYKHIFGENFSASAIAFYVAVTLLSQNHIPDFLIENGTPLPEDGFRTITILNNSSDSTWSIIRVTKD